MRVHNMFPTMADRSCCNGDPACPDLNDVTGGCNGVEDAGMPMPMAMGHPLMPMPTKGGFSLTEGRDNHTQSASSVPNLVRRSRRDGADGEATALLIRRKAGDDDLGNMEHTAIGKCSA
jgi:hypothetical protein